MIIAASNLPRTDALDYALIFSSVTTTNRLRCSVYYCNSVCVRIVCGGSPASLLLATFSEVSASQRRHVFEQVHISIRHGPLLFPSAVPLPRPLILAFHQNSDRLSGGPDAVASLSLPT